MTVQTEMLIIEETYLRPDLRFRAWLPDFVGVVVAVAVAAGVLGVPGELWRMLNPPCSSGTMSTSTPCPSLLSLLLVSTLRSPLACEEPDLD